MSLITVSQGLMLRKLNKTNQSEAPGAAGVWRNRPPLCCGNRGGQCHSSPRGIWGAVGCKEGTEQCYPKGWCSTLLCPPVNPPGTSREPLYALCDHHQFLQQHEKPAVKMCPCCPIPRGPSVCALETRREPALPTPAGHPEAEYTGPLNSLPYATQMSQNSMRESPALVTV